MKTKLKSPHIKLVELVLEREKISQKGLERKSGIDQPTLSRILRGERKITLETLRKLIPFLSKNDIDSFFRDLT